MGNCAREGPQSIELSQDPRGIWFGPDHGMHNVGDAVTFYTANVLLPFVYLRRNLPEESHSHAFPTWKPQERSVMIASAMESHWFIPKRV